MKSIISKSTVRKAIGISSIDERGCLWLEMWIEQLVRENSYPPQLKSNDFYSLLSFYFDNKTVLNILERLRRDYSRSFNLQPVKEEDDLSWLSETIKSDCVRLSEIPPNYL
jgi:hypothetical protein